MKDWIEEKGRMDTVVAYIQELRGGVKGYDPGDRKHVSDGDTLVCAGEHSLKRARDFVTAVDIEVVALKDLRKKTRQ